MSPSKSSGNCTRLLSICVVILFLMWLVVTIVSMVMMNELKHETLQNTLKMSELADMQKNISNGLQTMHQESSQQTSKQQVNYTAVLSQIEGLHTMYQEVSQHKTNRERNYTTAMSRIQDMKDAISTSPMCFMGMGTKIRSIPNFAITASSAYSTWFDGFHGRLDNKYASAVTGGSWAVKRNAIGEWLQVDFGSVKEIAGLITQGRDTGNWWVRTYNVSCGSDPGSLEFVEENGEVKVFTGNVNINTKVYNQFPAVISCRFIRIYPQTWNTHISMRVEFVAGACFNTSYPLSTI